VSKTILICDDELFILRAVSLKLTGAGYQTLSATDGAEGLDVALREQPDMIITDCQMPQMTGIELCERLGQEPTTRNIPVVMLTGKGFELDEQETRQQLGIRALLSKPFSPRELLALVDSILADSGSPAAATVGKDEGSQSE